MTRAPFPVPTSHFNTTPRFTARLVPFFNTTNIVCLCVVGSWVWISTRIMLSSTDPSCDEDLQHQYAAFWIAVGIMIFIALVLGIVSCPYRNVSFTGLLRLQVRFWTIGASLLTISVLLCALVFFPQCPTGCECSGSVSNSWYFLMCLYSFGAGAWFTRGWIACALSNREQSASTAAVATLSAVSRNEGKSKAESSSQDEVADRC
jgi:hypothetical protein